LHTTGPKESGQVFAISNDRIRPPWLDNA